MSQIELDLVPIYLLQSTSWIEALTWIAHDDKHPPRLITSDAQLYLLAGILFASMHNSVGQGLAQGRLNFEFFSSSAIHLLSKFHDLLDDWRNFRYVSRKRRL